MTSNERSDENGLVDALAQAAFATMAELHKLAADNDLSLTQLRVLAILRGRRVRMTTLSTHLGLEKSTLTGLVDRAEKRGLVTRARSVADGRAIDVQLSRTGLALARRMQHQIADALRPLTERLTPAEARRLQSLLERMLGTAHP